MARGRAPRFARGSYAWVAADYARKVVAGKIAASWQVRAACQRTLDDLVRTDITFSTKHVDDVCGFMENLIHIKGKWAGKHIHLEPFQIWILANLFGFLRLDGFRRFRSAFVLLPRKNGKSLLAAGIALYMTFADYEAGAEGYCGANNMKQADEVFGPAKKMAELSPGFAEAFGVEVMAKSIFATGSGSSFQPVIAKTRDGSSPHLAICDELHEATSPKQIQAFRTGMGARTQPLLLAISTAGFHLAGVCRTEQLDAEAVLKGATVDDALFAAIYTIDPGDDWKDFAVWKKANPNIGVTVTEDYLRQQLAKALQSPANQAFARTKYLNEWVASSAAWLNAATWAQAADPTLTEEALVGRPAWLGVDLSTRQDLTAIVIVVPLDDGRKAIIPHTLVPRGAVENSPNSTAYAGWEAAGHLVVTPGAASSFAEAEALINDLIDRFDVKHVVFDPWQGEGTRQRVDARGVPTSVWVANNRAAWALAMDDFEAELKLGGIVHPAHPVLDWCAANVCAWTRGRSRMPVKPSDAAKIDAMVATLMAFAASQVAPAAPPPPVQMFVLD